MIKEFNLEAGKKLTEIDKLKCVLPLVDVSRKNVKKNQRKLMVQIK